MLDFRHETFLLLCDLRSYTRTAERLCITQPAVSQHIRHLEELYGGKLFSYDRRKLALTERGRRLYDLASTVNVDGAFLRRALRGHDGRGTSVSFGATLSIGEYVMPDILAQMLKDDAAPALHMQVNNTHTLLKKLREGEIHFALLEGFFAKEEYDWRIFSREDFIGVCSPRSPLAERDVEMSDVLRHRLFVRESGSGTREIFAQMLREQNHAIEGFRDVCIVGNMSAIKQLVQRDLGISFLYRVVAEREIQAGTLKPIRIRGVSVQRAFHFVFAKGSRYEEQYLDWHRRFLEKRGGWRDRTLPD